MLPSPQFPGIDAPHVDLQAVRDGRRSTPKYIDIDLSTVRSSANNTALILQISGNSFYIDANPTDGNAIVHFQDQNSDISSVPFYVCPGFIAKTPFTFVAIENAAQPGKKIRIVYGIDIDFTPNTTSQIGISGNVSVIDGGRSRTLSNSAFTMGASFAGVNLPTLQLWNPVGSGKRLILENITCSSSSTGTIIARAYNVQLTNLVSNGVSKYLGGAAAVGQCRSQDAVSTLPATPNIISQSVQGGTPYPFTPREPIIIPEGQGLTLNHSVNAAAFFTTFEWYEEVNGTV